METNTANPTPSLAVARSVVWDASQPGTGADRSSALMSRERTAHYDLSAKKTRFAWERRRVVEVSPGSKDARDFQYEDIIVNEVSPDKIQEMLTVEDLERQDKEREQRSVEHPENGGAE